MHGQEDNREKVIGGKTHSHDLDHGSALEVKRISHQPQEGTQGSRLRRFSRVEGGRDSERWGSIKKQVNDCGVRPSVGRPNSNDPAVSEAR